MNKLEKKIIYTGTITLKTGLHIGGTNAALNIGGPDKFVVRNPINNIPYIPGSSLKGKMRSLVEIYNGEANNGKPSNKTTSKAGALFGVSGDSDNSHPSRLIVRDAELDINSCDFSKTDLPYTESKTEVNIDRVTAKANPRTFERVPAGAKFKLRMVLNIFSGEDEAALKKTLLQAIQLLEDDYLGGQGSRGYGQVEIKLDKIEGEERTNYPYKSI
ncbi:MAG: type III-A CRISPR-associated RAMP protein Csm3 [Bacteroides pyogenes]|uniref:type III-A CRISPR-associated RAMP protein Csm3 n=1 Tax=Bacteroides pyogenes TaxID=310300 RepID=UPI002432F74D|nr:type III-A CRISPR-associated RAMP protein Csm3 [Bacteroides pyogenes]MCI7069917.1 type III-A CRISPR-associated RAMP protein Csm3 [Bacteroides pyogenes]